MKIGIDCRLAGVGHAGIGRYIENLVIELSQLPQQFEAKTQHRVARLQKFEYQLFFSNTEQRDELLAKLKPTARVSHQIVGVKHYSLAEQVRLPAIFNQANLSLLHVPHFNVPVFYQGKLIVTIHDLLWHHHRGGQVTTLNPFTYWLKYGFYRYVTRQATSKADRILVPTQAVKGHVIQYYPEAQTKIVVIPEGVRLPNPSAAKRRAGGNNDDEPYLLYVGSLYPHKNIKVVLESLTSLPHLRLKIAGSRSVFTDQTQTLADQLGVRDRIDFLGRVSDQELSELYQQALATVQPSLSEGFGLTGLEALSAGTPLLASEIPVFHEVYQDGAHYFNPHSPSSLVNSITQLQAATKTEKQRLKQKGIQVASQYSWKKMARATLDAYQIALTGSQ
jgi:glycosyltransferase involved in cell wall biosynthesis